MLPDGWKKYSLQDVVEFTNGKAHEQDIANEGQYIVVNSRFISSNGEVIKYSNSMNCPAQKDDILIVMSDVPNGRAIARCFLVDQGQKYTVNQRIGLLRPTKIDPLYLLYSLDRNPYFLRFDDGIKQTNLRKDEVLECPVAIPNLIEQKEISSIIKLCEDGSELLKQQIEEKQKQKKALMQGLLTGKHRFPEFKGQEWQEVELGDVFKRVRRKNEEGNTSVVTISGQQGFVLQSNYFKKNIASETLDNYFLLHKGEFAYNKSYSNGYPMGAIKRLNVCDKGVVTTLYICFALKDENKSCANFFEQFFESGSMVRGLSKIANEGGRAHGLLNVTPDDFFKLKMKIPRYAEQQKIAAVLNAADREIELLTQKLGAYQEQKKGLMQQLLTGKKRVNLTRKEAA